MYSTFWANIEDIFLDISKDYAYYEELELLYDRGMIFPDSEWKFSANKLLNRDEFVWISMEVSCRRCISPETNASYIREYSWTDTFYDVPASSKYFYCIAESDNKSYVKWYDAWFQCDSWKQESHKRPFCVDNKITLEEALAVLLRNSWIFTVEDNTRVIEEIDEWKISQKLASDLLPRNSDGSAYTFYWYFRKALELELVEYDTDWNEKTYRLLDPDALRFNPDKSISKEDFLKMAYIILKSNSCKQQLSSYSLPVSLSILDATCKPTDTNCVDKKIDPNDSEFDFSWSWAGICEKWIDSSKGYMWKMYHRASGKEVITYWSYIDNASLKPSWKWDIYLYAEDNCWNTGRSLSTLYVNWNDWDEKVSDLSVSMTWWPLVWPLDTRVSFVGDANWWDGDYLYKWKYWDWKSGEWKDMKHVYDKPWKYTLELEVKDWEWNSSTATSTIVVTEKTNSGSWNTWIWVQITGGPFTQYVWWAIDFWSMVRWGEWGYTYNWDFWDGIKSDWEKFIKTYEKPWVYVVTLEVVDDSWKSWSAEVTIVIIDNSLWDNNSDGLWVKIIADPLKQRIGEDINFDSQISWWDGNYTYIWDFWDNDTWTNSSSIHQYDTPWIYIVDLDVVDGDWKKGTSKVSILLVDPQEDYSWEKLWARISWGPFRQSIDEDINFEWVGIWWDGSYSYDWYFWNGVDGSSKDVVHYYEQPGTYEVVLEITDGSWKTATAIVTVVIIQKNGNDDSNSLSVWIDAEPLKVSLWEKIDYTWLVEWWNGVYTYKWNYGDGDSETWKDNEKKYTKPGWYVTTLEVIDSDWKTWNARVQVVITDSNTDPNDDWNWDDRKKRLWVEIKVSPDTFWKVWDRFDFEWLVTWWSWKYLYSWKLSDGTLFKWKEIDHDFSKKWIYRIYLWVIDDKWNSGSSEVTIVVQDTDWNWNPITDSETDKWLWVQVRWIPSTQYVWEPINFEWFIDWWDGNYIYAWDFWDGWIWSEKKLSHTYNQKGTYRVQLIWSDGTNRIGKWYVQVYVRSRWNDDWNDDWNWTENNSKYLWVSISWDGNGVDLGNPVKLTWIASGWDGNYEYTWDYWDSVIWDGKIVNHVYEEIWVYTVKLIVTDWEWRTWDSQVIVSVNQSSVWWGFIVTMTRTPPIGNQKLSVDFIANVSPLGEYTYEWDFGDGTTGRWKVITHVYKTKGFYVATVYATDTNAKTGSAKESVRVLSANSCELDWDDDGVPDCRDACPLVSGSSLNWGCPILDDFCKADCSCDSWYKCTSNDPKICSTQAVCKPYVVSINPCLEKGHSAFIYGNTTCNSCPCSHSIDFNSILRKCDVIFPAITSIDSTELFSRGDVYTISE